MNYDNNAYYEAPYDDQEEAERFEEEVNELLKDEFNPRNYDNFSEAVCEVRGKVKEELQEMLNQPQIDFEALGRKLYCEAIECMERYAIYRVERNLP